MNEDVGTLLTADLQETTGLSSPPSESMHCTPPAPLNPMARLTPTVASQTPSCSSPWASSSAASPPSTDSVCPAPSLSSTHILTPHACACAAPEPMQVGEHVVTQKSLYTGLFVIGIPLLWFSSPLSTIFWIVGASGILIVGHASLMEPGIESEYAQVQDSV